MADSRESARFDLRAELVDALLEKVSSDRFPSTTMLDMIEEMMDQREASKYASILVDRIRDDTFPSIPMIQRLQKLQG